MGVARTIPAYEPALSWATVAINARLNVGARRMRIEKTIVSRSPRIASGTSLRLCLTLLGITPACGGATETDESATIGEASTASDTGVDTGDGDGDGDGVGDGDGDGDPSTTGDGDGDGDPSTTGDGDGDGCPGDGTQVWINELHYDNDGADAGEFVELAGVAGVELSCWSLEFYNGNGGNSYGTGTFGGGVTMPDEGNGYGASALDYPGIQNGAPDGIALVFNGATVVEFLSYEGAMTAIDGPAAGLTSIDIGVTETANTAVGLSLQRIGNGSNATDFTWVGPEPASPGLINSAQTIP